MCGGARDSLSESERVGDGVSERGRVNDVGDMTSAGDVERGERGSVGILSAFGETGDIGRMARPITAALTRFIVSSRAAVVRNEKRRLACPSISSTNPCRSRGKVRSMVSEGVARCTLATCSRYLTSRSVRDLLQKPIHRRDTTKKPVHARPMLSEARVTGRVLV